MSKIILLILLGSSMLIHGNAQYWSPAGSGIGSAYNHSVNSLAQYNGELYAGGYFSNAGDTVANNMAKWNGSEWSALTSGVNGMVHALCVFNGELYAGGNFSTAGGVTATGIAKWNGINWSAVGNIEADVKAMTVYNGELYAAGWFSNSGVNGTSIAKWNGNSWAEVVPEDSFYSVSIECMTVYNGNLYAAGAYYQIGGGGVAEFFRITKWDGYTWTNFLTIPASYTLDGALGAILSMTVYNGELYIAGNFTGVDTIQASQIAKWNGASWSVVGTGINFESYPYGFDGSYYTFVKSLQVYDGVLYATGGFTHCGEIQTQSIAKWNGNNWSNLGLGLYGNAYPLNGLGYTMASTDTALFVGGFFNYVNGFNGVAANNIAVWKVPCTAAPSQPAIIHGNTSVCAGTQQTFFVNEISGNTDYTWTLPSGWTGSSTTNSISVVIGNTSGTIFVTANNSCGNSTAQTLDVTVLPNTVPAIPGNITGNNLPCAGSSQTYFIAPVSNAIDYTWILPQGWTGNSPDTSITVTISQSGDFVAVTANNDCGSSIPKVLPVSIGLPPQKPGLIQGKQIVCIGTSQLYYVSPGQSAINYTWTLPQGWTGNSYVDSISVVAGNNNGFISVSAYNYCGSSDYTTLAVSVDSIPSQPGNIIGNIYTTTNEFNYYSIVTVAGANAYNWTATDAIIQGQNSNSISVIWKKAGTYELSVQAVNNCGTTARRKISVTVSDYDDNNPFNLQIFPNPSNGKFYLEAKRLQDKKINLEILNASGQRVYVKKDIQGVNNYSQLLDLKKLASGVYIVKVIVNDKVHARRIVINP